jgi:hypothetical protein
MKQVTITFTADKESTAKGIIDGFAVLDQQISSVDWQGWNPPKPQPESPDDWVWFDNTHGVCPLPDDVKFSYKYGRITGSNCTGAGASNYLWAAKEENSSRGPLERYAVRRKDLAKVKEWQAKNLPQPESPDDVIWFEHYGDSCPLPDNVDCKSKWDDRQTEDHLGGKGEWLYSCTWNWKQNYPAKMTHYGIKCKDLPAVLEWQKYNLKPKALPNGWIPMPEGLERMPEWVKSIGCYTIYCSLISSYTWGNHDKDHLAYFDEVKAIFPIPSYEGGKKE